MVMSYRPGMVKHANDAAMSRLQQPAPQAQQPQPQPQAKPTVAEQPRTSPGYRPIRHSAPPMQPQAPTQAPAAQPDQTIQPVSSFKPYGMYGISDHGAMSQLPPREVSAPTGKAPPEYFPQPRSTAPPAQAPPPEIAPPERAVWNMDTYNYMIRKYGY